MTLKAKIIHGPQPTGSRDFSLKASLLVDSKHSFRTSEPKKIRAYKERVHHQPFRRLFRQHKASHLHQGTLHLIMEARPPV